MFPALVQVEDVEDYLQLTDVVQTEDGDPVEEDNNSHRLTLTTKIFSLDKKSITKCVHLILFKDLSNKVRKIKCTVDDNLHYKNVEENSTGRRLLMTMNLTAEGYIILEIGYLLEESGHYTTERYKLIGYEVVSSFIKDAIDINLLSNEPGRSKPSLFADSVNMWDQEDD